MSTVRPLLCASIALTSLLLVGCRPPTTPTPDVDPPPQAPSYTQWGMVMLLEHDMEPRIGVTGQFRQLAEATTTPSALNPFKAGDCRLMPDGQRQGDGDPSPAGVSLDAGDYLDVQMLQSSGARTQLLRAVRVTTSPNEVFYTQAPGSSSAVPVLPSAGLTLDVPGKGAIAAQTGVPFPTAPGQLSYSGPNLGLVPLMGAGYPLMWENPTNQADTVAVFLGSATDDAASGGGVVVQCVAPDAGTFSLPAAFQARLVDLGYSWVDFEMMGRVRFKLNTSGSLALFTAVGSLGSIPTPPSRR